MPFPVRRSFAFAAPLLLLLPIAATASPWDYDTIGMERSRFPGTLELITGKFLRHSPEFYQWRIENRLKRLEADPTDAGLLDDLSVAYDKTGQYDKAIETALRTEKVRPGRYETASNLATFHFHAGRLEAARPHLDRAMKLKPDAAPGRDKYRKLLLEYVLKRCPDGALKLPLAKVEVSADANPDSPSARDVAISETFADSLRPAPGPEPTADEQKAAIQAVLGMMKFAQPESPVLLEALASLFVRKGWTPEEDAKHLAARAYLKASYEVPEGPARVAYRGMAANALRGQAPQPDEPEAISLEAVEKDFEDELTEAREWYADLYGSEQAWIREGKNPEVEFAKLYDAEPAVSGRDGNPPWTPRQKRRAAHAAQLAGSLIALAAIAIIAHRIRRQYRRLVALRSRPSPAAPPPEGAVSEATGNRGG